MTPYSIFIITSRVFNILNIPFFCPTTNPLFAGHLHCHTIYTDEPKHYDHLPNMLRVRPKAWTLQDLWRCPVVLGIKTLGPLNPVSCEVEVDQTCCSSTSHRAMPWTLRYVPQTIPKQFVQYYRVLKVATAIGGILLSWRSVPCLQQCLGRWHMSNWNPHDPQGFPAENCPEHYTLSTSLSSSHSASWCHRFPR